MAGPIPTPPPLPTEDQQITLVSVRDGQITVLPARVLVVRPHKVALSLEAPSSEVQRWVDGHAVTLLYTHGEHILRLRSELREVVGPDRITVEPMGDAKEGDRRDFRRADMSVQVYAKRAESKDPGKAREAQLASPVALDDPGFALQVVNLSGSGVSFNSSEPIESDDLVDVRLVVDLPPKRMIAVIGRAVRIVPGTDGGPANIAVRFAELSEGDQDAIIYGVFSHHFATEGLEGALSVMGDDDAQN